MRPGERSGRGQCGTCAPHGGRRQLQQARPRARAGVLRRSDRATRAHSQAALAERERLTQLMGLWGEDMRFTLPERLPDLPASAREIADLESNALWQRLDVQGAMKEAESVASSLGLTRAPASSACSSSATCATAKPACRARPDTRSRSGCRIFDWGGARSRAPSTPTCRR